MICPNCSHENEGGKFCVKCGTQLSSTSDETVIGPDNQPVQAPHQVSGTKEEYVSQPEPASNVQASQYVEGAKKISKSYFNSFVQVLKQPYSASVKAGEEQFINGIITIILYSLLVPLIIYFALKGVIGDLNDFGAEFFGESMDINPPFADVVIKPFIAYVIFIFLIAAFSFVAVKLAKVNSSFKEIVSRFASFLIPFVTILALALILSLLNVSLFIYLLFFGLVGAIFLVPALVVTSYSKASQEGLDKVYGILITYVLTFIALRIMGEMLFDSLVSAFSSIFGGGFY
ncbi:zinc ribbon domain-containing protein [Bacillus litorisediminis]|uniref:zinc ribbon domain-containing protein n=1 Tax=Bacillus litorisediminis TaxID=2922713 RepID=UPI001FABEAAA|nr:zinc ribbon domain-containing protein [Bacillus litorisediminis]